MPQIDEQKTITKQYRLPEGLLELVATKYPYLRDTDIVKYALLRLLEGR